MKSILILLCIGTALLLAACAPTPDPQAMAATYVAETMAAASPTPPPSDTPVPTDTPEPTATPTQTPTPTETLVPTATPTITPDSKATDAALATEKAAEAMELVQPVLDTYNISAEDGKVVWVQDEPLEVYNDEYRMIYYDYLSPKSLIVKDFVMSTDVYWSSTEGLAGCGLLFRGEKELVTGEQYQFFAYRFSGLPAWNVEFWNFGDWQYTVTGEMRFSNAIDLKDESTNQYVLILRDKVFTIYANGTRLGTMEIAKRSNGIFGVLSWQDSGNTTCIYKNTWIWEYNE